MNFNYSKFSILNVCDALLTIVRCIQSEYSCQEIRHFNFANYDDLINEETAGVTTRRIQRGLSWNENYAKGGADLNILFPMLMADFQVVEKYRNSQTRQWQQKGVLTLGFYDLLSSKENYSDCSYCATREIKEVQRDLIQLRERFENLLFSLWLYSDLTGDNMVWAQQTGPGECYDALNLQRCGVSFESLMPKGSVIRYDEQLGTSVHGDVCMKSWIPIVVPVHCEEEFIDPCNCKKDCTL